MGAFRVTAVCVCVCVYNRVVMDSTGLQAISVIGVDDNRNNYNYNNNNNRNKNKKQTFRPPPPVLSGPCPFRSELTNKPKTKTHATQCQQITSYIS